MTIRKVKPLPRDETKEIIKWSEEETDTINDNFDAVDQRVDNIISTPTTVSQQEIIDARQGELSLGANISAIKNSVLDIDEKLDNDKGTTWEALDELLGRLGE
jgi:hypothetical protein